jgi:hypothetical protein
MTQRYRSQHFPSIRGGIDWWSCTSRSPLLNPSSICKDDGRDGEEARFLGSTIENERERVNRMVDLTSSRRKKGYLWSKGENYPLEDFLQGKSAAKLTARGHRPDRSAAGLAGRPAGRTMGQNNRQPLARIQNAT